MIRQLTSLSENYVLRVNTAPNSALIGAAVQATDGPLRKDDDLV